MAGETQGFRVKPDELLDVARKVQDLLDDVSGANGGTAGNVETFRAEAGTEHVQAALTSLFPQMPPGAAYVEAYGLEYRGMQTKYDAIIGHLTALASACRQTAEQYGAEDQYTQTAINQTEAGPGPATPPEQTPVRY